MHSSSNQGANFVVGFHCDAHFRPFDEESSDSANQTPSTTADGKAHNSDTVKELPAFWRSEGDAMCDEPVDLALYMHHDTSNNATPMKITSRL